jgi:mortality factor 4-like protein 1
VPRTPNVSQILDLFSEHLAKKQSVQESVSRAKFNEAVLGLKAYFDKALGSLLLYRFERPQYRAVLEDYPMLDLSAIYGLEHLLRLIGTLTLTLTLTLTQ